MIASVGSSMRGSSTSSTLTLRGRCQTTAFMTHSVPPGNDFATMRGSALQVRPGTADNPPVTLLFALVGLWCLLSAVTAFGLGPLLHKAAILADAREPARPAPGSRAVA